MTFYLLCDVSMTTKRKNFEIMERERVTLAVPYTLEEPMSDKPSEDFEIDL